MRIKLLALMLLPLLCANSFASRRSQIEDLKSVTVLVTNEGFLGSGRGSGVLIDADHVLTCAHMARSFDDELFVYTYPLGAVIKAKVESVDTSADLLLLKLDRPVIFNSKAVFQEDSYDGESVTVIGNTLGSMYWYVSSGIISGNDHTYLLTTAAIHPGNSGGPWFNEAGEVLAISDWGLRSYPDIAGGISAKTINATMKRWEEQKKMADVLSELLK